MARSSTVYRFEFDRDEGAVLLKLVGRESPDSIREMGGLDVEAFERVYEALADALFQPALESHP